MEGVKSVGGVGLIVMALYFVRPLIRGLRTFASPEMWFLGITLAMIVAGIALGAIHLSFHGPAKQKVRKGLAVALLVAGSFGVYSWYITPATHLPWLHDEAAAFAKAKAEGKGVFIDFSATWCTPCNKLDVVFGDVDVHTAIVTDFVPLKFDVSDDTEQNDALKHRFEATNLPAVRFRDADNNPIGEINKEIGRGAALEAIQAASSKLHAARTRAANP
jgi:thiol:disulfide interchange protein DsbD